MSIRQLNILLADDDIDDCIFFKKALDELLLSTHLTVVHDGEQLIQQLINGTNEFPDVLFLDLNMPRKNGFECLSDIKLSKNLNKLPVIIFSTSFEQEVVNQLYQNGAHYFIRKPSEFSQFKKIIQHSLALISQETISQPTRENFTITLQNSLMM
jgi:CheY-like chemotaxis protein